MRLFSAKIFAALLASAALGACAPLRGGTEAQVLPGYDNEPKPSVGSVPGDRLGFTTLPTPHPVQCAGHGACYEPHYASDPPVHTYPLD